MNDTPSTEVATDYAIDAFEKHISNIKIYGDNLEQMTIIQNIYDLRYTCVHDYASDTIRTITSYSDRDSGGKYILITYTYQTTIEEEQYLDQIVAGFLPGTEGMTEYEKVRAIHK